jgi:hypothetical protein
LVIALIFDGAFVKIAPFHRRAFGESSVEPSRRGLSRTFAEHKEEGCLRSLSVFRALSGKLQAITTSLVWSFSG